MPKPLRKQTRPDTADPYPEPTSPTTTVPPALTVLDEMAARLRHAGCWDNRLGDALAVLVERFNSLERFTAAHTWSSFKITTRPLKSWDDVDAVLMSLLGTFIEAGVRCWVYPGDVFWIIRKAAEWRSNGLDVPTTLRIANFGDLVVEWTKGRSLIISRGHVAPVGDVIIFLGTVTNGKAHPS